MTQQRIEVSLAGHKITLATTSDHEPLLREACAFADEQIQLALASGNKSIGLGIRLPQEQRNNKYITPELSFQFHYFFTLNFHL